MIFQTEIKLHFEGAGHELPARRPRTLSIGECPSQGDLPFPVSQSAELTAWQQHNTPNDGTIWAETENQLGQKAHPTVLG
jgi:hypothetical protein